jgi:hypothetical protein
LASLVAYDLCGLDKQLFGMGFDFLVGRYDEVRRGLRFAWELLFRAYAADCPAVLPSNVPRPTGARATLEAKLVWLETQERYLDWQTVITPVLRELFPADGDVERQFKPVWFRLNSAVHPSASGRVSAAEASRHLWFRFDEGQARQLVADAREVFGLIWAVVLMRFPRAAERLTGNREVFRACPQVRLLLPGERDSAPSV